MYDAGFLSDALGLQRAVGELRVEVRARSGSSVLDGLRQSGCLKARFPRTDDARWLNIVTLNTSGGIVAGDVLDSAYTIAAGAHSTIAAQAAERFYRASPGSAPARVSTRIEVGAGGSAEWLPQETILFDRCALRRHLRVELAADAWFLGVESLVFGRAAMGESLELASLRDLIEVRRNGRLLLHDAIKLDGAAADLLRHKAIADGARAVATVVHIAPDAESMLDRVRAAAPQCGVSAWNGMLLARVVAADGASLRTAVTEILHVVRDRRPLPRVWLC
jgi:urease accessory protein